MDRMSRRADTRVFAAIAVWAIPTARRIWISCRVMAPITPPPSREAFGGRFARVERDLRACLDRPESSESGVLRGRLSPRQLDGQAQLGETPRVVLDESLAVETVEVVRSQVVVFDAVAQNVPGGDEDGVSNRDNRLLVSAPSG